MGGQEQEADLSALVVWGGGKEEMKNHCQDLTWGGGGLDHSGFESWEMKHSILHASWGISRVRATNGVGRSLLPFAALIPLAFHSGVESSVFVLH